MARVCRWIEVAYRTYRMTGPGMTGPADTLVGPYRCANRPRKPPRMTTRHHLIAADTGGQPPAPEQRRFNQLLARIEKARASLEAWDEQGPLFARGHSERVAPLQAELRRQQATLVRRLDALLGDRSAKWTKGDRRRIRRDLCDLIAGLLGSADDEPLVAEMKALFVRHAGHDYDTENREAMAAMKEMLEAVSGLDLGEEEFADEEALLHAASRRFAESQEQKVEQRASRKPNTAQRRRERERAEASRSLREVYRKLAAALHPDRADGEVDRVRRNELMQRANRAYGANDLLALLALQLEIEQVDAAHLARATAERVRQYNLLLGDQLREIHAEIDARRFALCIDCGLDPDHPPRLEQLGSVLEGLVRECRAGLVQAQRDLAQLDDPVTAKLFLRRRWREVDDQMPF
jgi:hypothetical protein